MPGRLRLQVARAVCWIALVVCAVLGFAGGMGRGIGLVLGVAILAVYVLARHGDITAFGYVLLTLGLLAVAALWLAVPILRN